MQSTFEKKNGLKRLIEFQHNMSKLIVLNNCCIECIEQDSWSLDFFNKEYSWSCRSCCGFYSYLTSQEIIDYDEYLYKIGSK